MIEAEPLVRIRSLEEQLRTVIRALADCQKALEGERAVHIVDVEHYKSKVAELETTVEDLSQMGRGADGQQ